MNLSQIVRNMFDLAVVKIKENVNKEIEGQEKKTKVDAAITTWLNNNVEKLGTVQQFIVTQYILPSIPIITQSIYGCLKQKIEGMAE